MENIIEISDKSAEYHVNAKRWKSDLEFYTVESSFFGRLKHDYYFTRLEDYKNTEQLQKAGEQLLKLQVTILAVKTQVEGQLSQLAAVAENEFAENSKDLALANASVLHLMINLAQDYQEMKKDFFLAIEGVFRELELDLRLQKGHKPSRVIIGLPI